MRIFQETTVALKNELWAIYIFRHTTWPKGSVRVRVAFNLTQDGILEMDAKMMRPEQRCKNL